MNKKQTRFLRIVSMCGVCLLLGLILATLIVAVFDVSGRLFQALLFADIGVPILFWIWMSLYQHTKEKKNLNNQDNI